MTATKYEVGTQLKQLVDSSPIMKWISNRIEDGAIDEAPAAELYRIEWELLAKQVATTFGVDEDYVMEGFDEVEKGPDSSYGDDWDWADINESILEDCEQFRLSDTDLYMVWRMGLAAFQVVNKTGE